MKSSVITSRLTGQARSWKPCLFFSRTSWSEPGFLSLGLAPLEVVDKADRRKTKCFTKSVRRWLKSSTFGRNTFWDFSLTFWFSWRNPPRTNGIFCMECFCWMLELSALPFSSTPSASRKSFPPSWPFPFISSKFTRKFFDRMPDVYFKDESSPVLIRQPWCLFWNRRTFSAIPLVFDMFVAHKMLCGLCFSGILLNMTRSRPLHGVWCCFAFYLIRIRDDIDW